MRTILSRRRFLPGLGAAVAMPLLDALCPPRAAEQPSTTSSAASSKLRVVVTGGHPGDPEYGCGGTVARYTDLGHEVILLYLNRGDSGYLEKPTQDMAPVRM